LSEALIFTSTNPQYDNRLFIELQVRYMKIPCSNLGRTCCVQKLFPTFRTIFVHNMFSPCSAKRRASDRDLPVLCTLHALMKKLYPWLDFNPNLTPLTLGLSSENTVIAYFLANERTKDLLTIQHHYFVFHSVFVALPPWTAYKLMPGYWVDHRGIHWVKYWSKFKEGNIVLNLKL